MDKSSLIAMWHSQLQEYGINISQKKLKIAFELLLDVVKSSLAAGVPVKLMGFGSLVPKIQAERMRRDPRTNQEVRVPEKKVVKFKPGKTLLSEIQH